MLTVPASLSGFAETKTHSPPPYDFVSNSWEEMVTLVNLQHNTNIRKSSRDLLKKTGVMVGITLSKYGAVAVAVSFLV